MTWFKVDDGLHSHRKAVRAGIPAMGLWVMAGAWCADQLSNGFIPDYMVFRLDRDADVNAKSLVDVGLWEPAEQGGEKGWQFHDWTEHQPTREEAQAAAARKSTGGKLGNHRRWHIDGKTDPRCPFCVQPTRSTDRITDRNSDRSQESDATPLPIPRPGPTRPDPTRSAPAEQITSSSSSRRPNFASQDHEEEEKKPQKINPTVAAIADALQVEPGLAEEVFRTRTPAEVSSPSRWWAKVIDNGDIEQFRPRPRGVPRALCDFQPMTDHPDRCEFCGQPPHARRHQVVAA